MKNKNIRQWMLIIFILYTLTNTCVLAKEEVIAEKIPFSYEANKNLIKSREGALKVKDKLYIEVKELSRLLGLESNYQNNILSIKKKEKENPIVMDINEGIITKIDITKRTILVVENKEVEGEKKELIIKVGEDTAIEYPTLSKRLSLDVLKEGMKVAIQYKNKSSKDDYYEALYIELLEENFSKGRLIPTIENAYIIGVDEEKEYIIVAKSLEDRLDVGKQIIVYVDHHTNIRQKKDKGSMKLDELKLYQKVTIITNGIMTNSSPIQTVGLEIIIL